ncbi:hypothetical protein UR09_02385 [Candidatus Nitromaritima sp. SCGC AAA799-A02]|nr:hypothetical protein UZ36_03360 [Candidatus Nitromaritima sp. SCGC AAA799-C22]KMP11837.1 hypothetical protein UR09_02385 [Candidatus Nitromaritima sp. SCGC AAA799-A02]
MDRPICILGALRDEINGIRRGMSVDEQFKAGRADVWSGTWEGARIVLVRTGVGKACAASALEEVLRRVQPSLILSVGYAGGLDPALNVGDLVVADRVLEESQSNTGTGYTIGSDWLARVEALTPPDGITLHRGVLVTVDEPVADPFGKRALAERHGAVAVDMETTVLIREAEAKGVPFLSVRAISDAADQSLLDVSSLIGEDGEVSKLKAGWYAVTHPQVIPHFISLRDQSQKAAKSLTKFLSIFLKKRK